MHTLSPILISEILSIQTDSPNQTAFPKVNNHGNLILTQGLMTTLLPISPPNNLRISTLNLLG